MQRVVFEIPDELKRKLNIFLAKRGRTIKDFMTQYLEDLLQNEKGD